MEGQLTSWNLDGNNWTGNGFATNSLGASTPQGTDGSSNNFFNFMTAAGLNLPTAHPRATADTAAAAAAAATSSGFDPSKLYGFMGQNMVNASLPSFSGAGPRWDLLLGGSGATGAAPPQPTMLGMTDTNLQQLLQSRAIELWAQHASTLPQASGVGNMAPGNNNADSRNILASSLQPSFDQQLHSLARENQQLRSQLEKLHSTSAKSSSPRLCSEKAQADIPKINNIGEMASISSVLRGTSDRSTQCEEDALNLGRNSPVLNSLLEMGFPQTPFQQQISSTRLSINGSHDRHEQNNVSKANLRSISPTTSAIAAATFTQSSCNDQSGSRCQASAIDSWMAQSRPQSYKSQTENRFLGAASGANSNDLAALANALLTPSKHGHCGNMGTIVSYPNSVAAANRTLAQIQSRASSVVTPSPPFQKESNSSPIGFSQQSSLNGGPNKRSIHDLLLPVKPLTTLTKKKLRIHKPKKLFLKQSPPININDQAAAARQAVALSDTSSASAASLAADMLRGVTIRPSGKWQAQYYYAGKSRYIGVFDTRERACLAYEIAREKLQGRLDDIKKQSREVSEEQVFLARKAALAAVDKMGTSSSLTISEKQLFAGKGDYKHRATAGN